MPITASTVTVAQYKEPEANVDSVTSTTVNSTAEVLLCTDVGQNDNRMSYEQFTIWIAGTGLTGGLAGLTIQNNAITEPLLATNSVSTSKLQDKCVTSAKLGDSSVTTMAIGDDQVTGAKIVANAISESHILNAAVTTNKLALNACTYDRFQQLPANCLLGNDTIAAANVSPIQSGDLPEQTLSGSSRVVGFESDGTLAKYDATALTATSRKDSVDDEGPAFAGIDPVFTDGMYDNKMYTLTQNATVNSLTATTAGEYQLWIKQDATGYRTLTLSGSLAIDPRISVVQLNPDSNQLTVIRLYYDGSTWHIG